MPVKNLAGALKPPAALFVHLCPFCCLAYSSASLADCPDCRPAAIAPGLVPPMTTLGPPTVVRISEPIAASIWARATPAKGSDHAER